MSSSPDRGVSVFLRAHHRWQQGDFEGFLECLDEEILYFVNVDGLQVPYASSSVGREDVRFRMSLLLKTMSVDVFDIEKHMVMDDHEVTVVHCVYSHRRTQEVLDIKVRFKGWERGGRIVQIEEIHDAKYVEAFERFVFFMQQTEANGAP